MANFEEIVDILVKNTGNTKVSIKGKQRQIKAMAKLASEHYLEEPYIKIMFTDSSFLLVVLEEKEIYFAEKLLGKAKDINDEEIGVKEILVYNDKEYKLANKNDYQYCIQLYFGSPLDIEGECRFSDYFPVTGPKEFLSLGWLSKTGERADINCQILDTSEISVS